MQPIKEKYEDTKSKYNNTKTKLEGRFFPWARKFWLEIILVSIVLILLLSMNFDISNLYPFVITISMVIIAVYVVMQYKLQQSIALESCRVKAMLLFSEAGRIIEESGDVSKGLPKMKEALVVARNGHDKQSVNFIETVIKDIEAKKITKANLSQKVGDFYQPFM